MVRLQQHFLQKLVNVNYFCTLCNEKHFLKIPEEKLQSDYYPTKYLYVHGRNYSRAVILYIDINHDVRGVEYIHTSGLEKRDIDKLVHKSLVSSLRPLHRKEILCYRLEYHGKILTEYIKQGYERKITLPDFSEAKDFSRRLSTTNEEYDEMVVVYSEYRLGFVCMMGANFVIGLTRDVDLNRFTTQILLKFEELLDSFF